MYSEDQYYNAIALYDKCGSVTKVITQLGYPVRRKLCIICKHNWIARRKHLPSGHSTFRGINTKEYPRHPALELKLAAIRRCFELGENVHLGRACSAHGTTKGKKTGPPQRRDPIYK